MFVPIKQHLEGCYFFTTCETMIFGEVPRSVFLLQAIVKMRHSQPIRKPETHLFSQSESSFTESVMQFGLHYV